MLKAELMRLASRQVDWRPPFEFDARLERAREHLQRSLQKLEGSSLREPPTYDLERLKTELQLHWPQGNLPPGWTAKDFRRAIWIAMDPSIGISAEAPFALRFLEDFGRRARPSWAVQAYQNFLRYYPTQAPSFETWRLGVVALMESHSQSRSPRFQQVLRRERTHRVLQRGAADALAKRHTDPDDLRQSLEEADGGQGWLRNSPFARQVIEQWLAHRKGTPSGLPDEGQLTRLLVDEDGHLRFEGSRAAYADSILPGVRRSGNPGDAKTARKFFLRHYGDPRLDTSRWIGVSREALGVMRGLLVEDTLEFFFGVIARYADASHWKYRQRFWRYFLKKGEIDEAWVALGPKADRATSEGAHGSLSGADSSKSILLLRIGRLVALEWSHSGACLTWRESDESKPTFYKASYDGGRIRRAYVKNEPMGRVWLAHHGSKEGRWQRRLAKVIADANGKSPVPVRHLL